MGKGITFLYEESCASRADISINNMKKIGKCLKDEGRNYVVYHPLYNEAEKEISNSITEDEMKKWLTDPQDKDLITTMSLARGWEANTIVAITDQSTSFIGNVIMRAVTKGRRVKKGFFNFYSQKWKIRFKRFEMSFWIKAGYFASIFIFNPSLFS